MIDGSKSEASGVGANGDGGDIVVVVAEDPRSTRQKKRVVDGERRIGRGGSDTKRSGYSGVGFVSVCLNGSVVAGGMEMEKGNGWCGKIKGRR